MDKQTLINVIEAHLLRVNTIDGGTFLNTRQELAAIYEIMLDTAKLIEDVK